MTLAWLQSGRYCRQEAAQSGRLRPQSWLAYRRPAAPRLLRQVCHARSTAALAAATEAPSADGIHRRRGLEHTSQDGHKASSASSTRRRNTLQSTRGAVAGEPVQKGGVPHRSAAQLSPSSKQRRQLMQRRNKLLRRKFSHVASSTATASAPADADAAVTPTARRVVHDRTLQAAALPAELRPKRLPLPATQPVSREENEVREQCCMCCNSVSLQGVGESPVYLIHVCLSGVCTRAI